MTPLARETQCVRRPPAGIPVNKKSHLQNVLKGHRDVLLELLSLRAVNHEII